jgi:hypothetical protein
MMSQDSKEILNCRFGGSIYPTITKAAVACIIDNLTAAGYHSASEALYIADQAGAAHVIAEISNNFNYDNDQVDELMQSWSDALDQLYEWRMHGVC